jgi:hypothetical protein
MSVTIAIVFGCALVVLAICMVLIFHPEYHDGLVRRIGLACLGLASWLRVLDILQNGWEHRPFSKMALLVWIGLVIFIGDHFYNFMRHLYASRKKQRRAEDKQGSKQNGPLRA